MTRASKLTRAGKCRLVVSVVAALVVVGCGGGSSKSADSTATLAPLTSTSSASSSPASASATSAPATAEDAQTATALMWSSADFPSGWAASTHQRSPDRKEVGDRLAACSGGVNVEAPVDVDAPDFKSGDLRAEMGVSIQTDAATVDADFSMINGPKFLDCLKAEIVRALGAKAQSPGVVVDVKKLDPPAGAPPSTVFVRSTISQNDTLILVSDVVLLGAGRTELTLGFEGKGTTFDEQLEADLVDKTAARLSAHPTS